MKANNVLLIYNPKSGNGMFKNNLDKIIEGFQKKKQFVNLIRGGRPELLDQVFRQMDTTRYCKVVAAGGDGTIHQVVNAMLRNGVDLPLGIFPAGTANDYAYYFDLPRDIEKMVEIAAGNKFTYADVGLVNGEECFINVLALGRVVDVSQKTDPNLKNALGLLSYYMMGLQEAVKLESFPVTIECEEFSGTEHIYFMILMNGRSAGGFRRIANKAAINDGLIDVIIFKEVPHITEFPQLGIDTLNGNHIHNKNVIFFQAKKLKIEAEKVKGTDMDGEEGPSLPIEVEVLPKKLRILTAEQGLDSKETKASADEGKDNRE